MINTLLFTTALIFVKADSETALVKADSETAPIDCVGKWENFKECSIPCGCGVQRQTYQIITKSSNGGKECEEKDGAMRGVPCNEKPCPVKVYSDWSECSVSCGEGTQTRTITFEDTGLDVPNPKEPLTQTCHLGECCKVGNFSEWSECSASCGPGTRTRSRDELTVNGLGCPDLIETEDCQIAECPIETVIQKDTICSKTELSSDLLKSESSCITADTPVCLKTCKEIDECKGFDEKDGECCFFSEALDEAQYEPNGLSSCYILTDEATTETQPTDYITLGSISASVIISLVLAFGVSKMLSGSSEGGEISKILATPLPRRNSASPVDAPNATPM